MNTFKTKNLKPFGVPTMSDRTILISVEDLISGAFGAFEDNTVNFQQVQTILGILARQMRILKQDVEIRFDDLGIDFKTLGDVDSRDRLGTGRGVARVGSIEVITASQFALLEEAVRNLEEATGPLPMPSMPDNEQLREDLAKGRATLADTMQALRINARVKAAEKGLARMADLLTQLAEVGLLPMEFVVYVGKMRADLKQAARQARMGEGVDRGDDTWESSETEEVQTDATYEEMEELIQYTKDEFSKDIKEYLAYAEDSADMASHASKDVSDKMEIILKMNNRITTLYLKNADFALQLDGFDSGLMSQLASFQEQMGSMRANLIAGVKLYETASNTAGSTAILDLNERYEGVLQELKSIIDQHKINDKNHLALCDEITNLIKCVEILREEKADSDEVNDGLRDKADRTRIVSILLETDFVKARVKLEQKIAKSYEQFNKLDTVWQKVLKDLMVTVERKAELLGLIELTMSSEKQLAKVREEMLNLEIMLGEPRAAFLVRKISTGGTCLTRALIEPKDRTYGKPLPVPTKRLPEPCLADVALPLVPADHREHICHRWVGGSHTMMPCNVAREQASLIKLELIPTKKYTGYGNDGRAAFLVRKISTGGTCLTRALIEPKDRTYGKPLPVPTKRLPEPCLADVALPLVPADHREHICHRWVGGSHTMMPCNVAREQASLIKLELIPTKKYTGYGNDGRLYMMEEDLQPCAECNRLNADHPGNVTPQVPTPTHGGGDQACY